MSGYRLMGEVHHYGLLLRASLDATQEVVDALGHILALDFLDLDSLWELLGLFFLTVLLCPGLSREIVAEEADELTEHSELLLVGILVDAVDEGLGLLALGHLAHVLCHRAVGQQHELLDEPVGLLGYLLVDPYRLAGLIHLDLHLGPLEGNGTGGEAFLPQDRGYLVQGCDLLGERTVAGLNDGLGLVVVEAVVGLDDGTAEPALLDHSRRCDVKYR